MKKHLFTSLLISLFLLLSCNSQQKEVHKSITLETLKQEVINKNVQLIDVRTPDEYLAGHIDDAINSNILNRDEFIKTVEKLDKSQPVYVYCKSGGRSNNASKFLQELGFSTVYDYSGGWSEWSKQ